MADILNSYTEETLKHFKNPHNMGEIKDASGKGRVGNPVCGDVMELQLKIEKKNGRDIISDAKFQTFGCGAAIATSSMLTDMIIGKPVEEAEKVTNKMIIDALGGLPNTKRHCSVLAEEALRKALKSYRENN